MENPGNFLLVENFPKTNFLYFSCRRFVPLLATAFCNFSFNMNQYGILS
jgi:hypothetical protein